MTDKSEPGCQGIIGRTLSESQPWWPDPAAPPKDAPGTVMIVLDDTGFAHLGCYGSTIQTPHMDRLAQGGLRYTSFHTTALCSPSRACLLTGRNHHSVGMRGVSNWDTGFPHMRGALPRSAAMLPELLRDHGYATYCAGKWHLAPMHESSAAGPHTNWPLQKGFDRFYGFLQGETDQFYPELTEDNHHIQPPGRPEDGYHVSEDLVDQSIKWIRDLKSVRPDRPFFLYLAFGAMHAPHQAPKPYIQKYRGSFDEGWDVAREEWFSRQLQMGIVPPDTTLAPRNPGVLPWKDLPANQQRFATRLQEAFAGFLEHTDAQIGRLVDFLGRQGLLDETLLILCSDNGASQEGGPNGVIDEFSFFNFVSEDIDDIVSNRLDDIGGPHSHSNIPWGWAQAGNTPLRWYKQNTYGGGVRDPLIVHWPDRIKDAGGLRGAFCHVVDIVPTILDVTGIQMPEEYNGVPQIPVHGESLAPGWTDPAARTRTRPQYFEQVGHRGIWKDGWKAVTYHLKGVPFEKDDWALYDLQEDFSECHDLAGELPEKLEEMVQTWWSEAEAYGVLPLDDRLIELFAASPRPGTPHYRDEYVYYPPLSHIPADASPALGGGSWSIACDIALNEPECEGVLYARGGHNVGHAFFAKDGRLHFEYNALGRRYRATGDLRLDPGEHRIEARLHREQRSGMLTLLVDGRQIGSAEVGLVVRILGSTGVDIGRNTLSPVAADYDPPFPFTGEIKRVTFRSLSRRTPADVDAAARTQMGTE